MIKNEKLDFWIQNARNVLFIGRHGVGKTSKVVEAFNRANLRWRHFSAATLDPWVDFIGVPRAVNHNGQEVLELIKPREFARDEVDAIFFDEFNRAHKKVRNAVMELLQFQSINGRKFENLKMIWAAINPEDDDRYDVEKLDEAQADRFHVHVTIPYKCDPQWFCQEFGDKTAKAAISWWNALPDQEKDKVSPRRLSYALREAQISGDMRDILPRSSNVSKLVTVLQIGPIEKMIKHFMSTGNQQDARTFLRTENNYSAAIEHIIKTKTRIKFFLPLIDPEKLAALLPIHQKVLDCVIENCKTVPDFSGVLNDVYTATANRQLKHRIEKLCENIPSKELPDNLSHLSNINNGELKYHHGGIRWKRYAQQWTTCVKELKKNRLGSTADRRYIIHFLNKYIPPSLTTCEATDTLDLLDAVASCSHAQTLKNMQSFIPLANHCCREIAQKSRVAGDGESLIRKHLRNNTKNILSKLRRINRHNQFDGFGA